MKGQSNLVAAGFALTALSYGLARFAYGLLLPQIRNDLLLTPTATGLIGGSAFAAYCLGIVFAACVGDRLDCRALLMTAGFLATIGMVAVALSPNGWVLGTAITLAGVGTGLTSPPLAAAVALRFDDEGRPKANGVINGGTAAGIVFCGLAAMAVAGAWRDLYFFFAIIGAGVTLWLWFAMPSGSGDDQNNAAMSLKVLLHPGLCGLYAGVGASSTAIWTFGADILRHDLAFSEPKVALAWVVLGAAGIVGSTTGVLTARFGIGGVHRLALLGMALGMAGLAVATNTPILAVASMGLFGTAYIISSGVLLIQGLACLPDRPDLGLALPFLAVAVGQTVGAPLFGALLETGGSKTALLSFAAIACIAMFWRSKTQQE